MYPYSSTSNIFKRLVFKYYPPSLIMIALTFYTLGKIFYEIDLKIGIFISVQLIMLSSWGIIIMALYVLRPMGLIKLLITMTGALFCGFVIQYIILAIFLDLSLWPFTNSIFPNKIIVYLFMNVVWCGGTFFLAERSIVAENKYKEEKTERLQSEKVLIENRLNLLQARIEPQFLFNTMETIYSLFDVAPEKAKKLQIHFIQYLRASLAKTRERYTTIEKEIEIISSYLDIYKISMKDRLKYSIDIDPLIKNTPFPSMLIQPIVENAIKNSIEKSSNGGQITITAKKTENTIKIKVSDTGKSSKEDYKVNNQIADVKERLASLYKEERLWLDNNEPSGLSVTIEVPFE